ncbi:protein JINGUBANG [Malania oleifera]|uniref:protein JINGUBANG n=1 Tax=Malania oleifera TaxID=397392 RepID=UPI0025ADCD82|nr:protein JINGUBANG [Malania oleifera]
MITCLAVHGNLLYAASVNQIDVFDLTSYARIDTFGCTDSTSSGSIKSIAFDRDGKIFTAHQDCKIRVWQISATTGREHHLVSTLPTMKDRLLRSVSPKNYVRVRRHKKQLWIKHADTVSGLVVQGGLVYSVSWDKSFKIWRASDHRCLESIRAHEDAVNALAVSVTGTVYTASADGRIRVWGKDVVGDDGRRKHSLMATLEEHKSTVNALALNWDGSLLFSGSCDQSIFVWEREEDSDKHMVLVDELLGHTGAVLCLINVGCLLISGSSDRTVRVWQQGVAGGFGCLAVLEGHERPVKSLVAVSREMPGAVAVLVCSGSLDGEIRVWELRM